MLTKGILFPHEIYMSLGNNLCQDDELEKYSQHVLNTVSKNVAKYRKEKGFTQMQLALEIGMSGGAYLGRAEIRKHDHHFNLKHLAKISKVLEIDIGEFFK